MAAEQLRPWSQLVHLHPDVERGDTAVAAYAIDLAALAAARKADVLAWQQQTVKVFGPGALPEGRQIAAENSSYLGQFGIHPGVQRITLNNAQQVGGVTVAADVTPLFPALPGGGRIYITREGFAHFAWR